MTQQLTDAEIAQEWRKEAWKVQQQIKRMEKQCSSNFDLKKDRMKKPKKVYRPSEGLAGAV